MLKILWVNIPGTDMYDEGTIKVINEVKRSDVEAKFVHVSKGPIHVEYHYYEHLNLHETLKWIWWADKNKFEAAVIGCFYDSGFREARELVRIPVIGPAEACMHMAATLGHKFSVIVGRRKWIPKMERNAYQYAWRRSWLLF